MERKLCPKCDGMLRCSDHKDGSECKRVVEARNTDLDWLLWSGANIVRKDKIDPGIIVTIGQNGLITASKL